MGNKWEKFARRVLGPEWWYYVPGSKAELAEWPTSKRSQGQGSAWASAVGKPPRCLATHTYLLYAWARQVAATASASLLPVVLYCLRVWAGPSCGWSLWSVLRPRLQERLGECRSGVFTSFWGKVTTKPRKGFKYWTTRAIITDDNKSKTISICSSFLAIFF